MSRRLKLKVGQDVWLTDYADYMAKHAVVVAVKEDGDYLIRRDDTTNPEMMADDADYCFKSAKTAYNHLIHECQATVREARSVWQHRRAELWRIHQRKKQVCKD